MDDQDKLLRIGHVCAEAFESTMTAVARTRKSSKDSEDRKGWDARNVAMWCAWKLFPRMPRRTVVRAYGRRDHSLVLEAVRRVMDLRDADPDYLAKTNALMERLQVEVGFDAAPPPPPRPMQKDGEAIGGGHELAWGFAHSNGNHRGYFASLDARFCAAMQEGLLVEKREAAEAKERTS
jgi:hypothetical protein